MSRGLFQLDGECSQRYAESVLMSRVVKAEFLDVPPRLASCRVLDQSMALRTLLLSRSIHRPNSYIATLDKEKELRPLTPLDVRIADMVISRISSTDLTLLRHLLPRHSIPLIHFLPL